MKSSWEIPCVRDKGLPKVEAGWESIQGLSPPHPHPSFLWRLQGHLSTLAGPPQRAAQVVHCRGPHSSSLPHEVSRAKAELTLGAGDKQVSS